MRVIGVTGGVGAGKSTVLGILEKDFDAYVIQADLLGHVLMEPGEECYDAVIALFGKEIIKKDKTIIIYTKGDANNDIDGWKVTPDMIIGIVKKKVPAIGFPTIWLNERW